MNERKEREERGEQEEERNPNERDAHAERVGQSYHVRGAWVRTLDEGSLREKRPGP
jgi:hypothetical protein